MTDMTSNEIANKLADKCAEQTIQSWLCHGNEISNNTTQTILSTTALVALVEVAKEVKRNPCRHSADLDGNSCPVCQALKATETELTRILGDEFKGL